MAWSIGDYNDFLEVVQDAFGLNRGEAAEVYQALGGVLGYGSLTVADLEEYADVVSDIVELLFGEEEEDDEWLDEGEEVEITADLHYVD